MTIILLARRVLRFGGIKSIEDAAKEFAAVLYELEKLGYEPQKHPITRYMVFRLKIMCFVDCGDLNTVERQVMSLAELEPTHE